MKVINDTYKKINGVKLPIRMYYPDEDTAACDIVICIHGGGWHAVCENTDWDGGWMDYQAQYYAKRGCIGAAFSYRSIDITKKTNVLDLYLDCIDAMKYITEHNEFNRVIVIGDSAGAHLAVMLGFDERIKTDIVIACNPVLDLTLPVWHYTAENEDTRKLASPFYNAKPTDTRFLFMHGSSDNVVDCNITSEFHNKLKNMNISSSFVKLTGVNHAFILKNYKSTDEELQKYMDIIDNYIEIA